jgi:ATP-dependent Clp protease ATP-binding subunit ClpB
LDDGKITDAQGRTVNFENTIIILTTNAGSDNSSSISGFAEKRESLAAEKTQKALAAFLRPEFINRIDEIITFHHLTKENFVRIADIMLGKLKGAMDDKGIKLTYSQAVLSLIAEESFSEKFGARNMRRYIERNVEDLIASTIIDKYPDTVCGVHLDEENKKIKLSVI